jgi:hypothetical protein
VDSARAEFYRLAVERLVMEQRSGCPFDGLPCCSHASDDCKDFVDGVYLPNWLVPRLVLCPRFLNGHRIGDKTVREVKSPLEKFLMPF